MIRGIRKVAPNLCALLGIQLRLLLFRPVGREIDDYRWPLLAYGFTAVWLAGIGRYWDHPHAQWWQYAGLSSLIYVLILGSLLYLIVLPLRPRRWESTQMLVFLGLTAMPAWLYAIPVERFVSMDTAQGLNVLFLAIVAAWRVALYAHFLRTYAELPRSLVGIATLLSVSAIIVALAWLNLEHVVFQIMAGLHDPVISAHDSAYFVVLVLSVIAWVLLPFLLLAYVSVVVLRWRGRKAETASAEIRG